MSLGESDIYIMNYPVYKHKAFLLSVFCLSSLTFLSACESMNFSKMTMKDHDMFSGHAGEAQAEAEAKNSKSYNGDGLTAMSNELDVASSSVEIFDMEPNLNYQRGGASNYQSIPAVTATYQPRQQQPQRSMAAMPAPSYGGASPMMMQPNDSSVTIYDVDSAQPIMGASPSYNMGFNAQNSYGSTSVYDTGSSAASSNQIFFKHGSSRLGSGDIRKISNLADSAKFAPVNYITVEGFASRPTQVGMNTTQAHILNLRQSMKRSEKVSRALIDKGVPGEKIKTVGWGATRATGRNSFDRRVDVVMGEK